MGRTQSYLGKGYVVALILFLSGEVCAFDLASSLQPREREGRKKNIKVGDLITVGGHATLKSIYPTVQYQRRLASFVSLGLLGLYSQANGTTKSQVFGGMLTLNLYLGSQDHRGLWIQGGGGFYNFDSQLEEQRELISRTAFLATVGYRGVFEKIFRVSVAGGILKMDPPRSKLVDYGVGGTIPILTFDIGFGF